MLTIGPDVNPAGSSLRCHHCVPRMHGLIRLRPREKNHLSSSIRHVPVLQERCKTCGADSRHLPTFSGTVVRRYAAAAKHAEKAMRLAAALLAPVPANRSIRSFWTDPERDRFFRNYLAELLDRKLAFHLCPTQRRII